MELLKRNNLLMNLLCIVGFYFAVIVSASAQSSSLTSELLAVQQERLNAAISRDTSKLEEIVADEVRYCHTNGVVDTKTSYLEMVRSGRIDWKEVNVLGMEARVYGDVGIIAGELNQVITVGGSDQLIEMHIRTIDVYVKRDGRWQLIEFQAANVR